MSIRILALDTATEACSAALTLDNKRLLERFMITPREHTKHILPMVDSLLKEADVTLNSLDVVAFSHGPGSFTGVRVGVGIAQGLALGANLPLIGISTMAVLAEGAWRQTGACRVLTAIDAHMGEVYWAAYKRKESSWLIENNEIVITPAKLNLLIADLSGYWAIAGNGWQIYPSLLNNDKLHFFSGRALLPRARDMLPIALHYYRHNIVQPAALAKPIYLRDKIT